jgi:heme exporter protein B
MSAFSAILRKDLRLELRGGESTVTLLSMSLLILVVLVFALDPRGGDTHAAAGALWIAMIFAGMLGATRVLLAERENGCIRALWISPADRAAIYCAKLVAAFAFMAVAELAATVLMVLFFNLEFDLRLARLAPIIGLGALGFSAVATLLAAISGRIRAGDLLLPLLLVPLFAPALVAGVQAGDAALDGQTFGQFAQWLRVLGAFDVLFLSAGYLLFEYLLSED